MGESVTSVGVYYRGILSAYCGILSVCYGYIKDTIKVFLRVCEDDTLGYIMGL